MFWALKGRLRFHSQPLPTRYLHQPSVSRDCPAIRDLDSTTHSREKLTPKSCELTQVLADKDRMCQTANEEMRVRTRICPAIDYDKLDRTELPRIAHQTGSEFFLKTLLNSFLLPQSIALGSLSIARFLSTQLAPYIPIAILRDSSQPFALISVFPIYIPNPITRCSVELRGWTLETQERRTRAIHSIACLDAR